MKIEKNKHNHKLTDLLKIVIFSLLMIAPLLASVSQMLYATFNKNAYLSTQMTAEHYHVEYEYETNEVNSFNDLVIGNIYTYTTTEFATMTIYTSDVFNMNLITDNDNFQTIYSLRNLTHYFINVNYVIFYQAEMQVAVINRVQVGDFESFKLDFICTQETLNNINTLDISLISASDYLGEGTIVSEPIQALDNAFYYGVDKMTQSSLFNWTENTLLYNGVKGMTDNLGVQTNAIAILITYWTILTIIYVILDIVIKGFTFITHLIVRSE